MINEALFSSNSDDWSTPHDIFQRLNKEFNFNLDPCASHENHKCNTYYTVGNDGLSQPWGGAECFAIHHIVKLINGLKRHIEKADRTTRLLCCLFRQEQIQGIFTTSFIKEQKSDLLKGD